ncbi:MAG: hypothetical protein GY822_16160, partial [Deltaproteobacteria bacterium]|nr:hypothetical protein [Deltaproteobacteria bacterium]
GDPPPRDGGGPPPADGGGPPPVDGGGPPPVDGGGPPPADGGGPPPADGGGPPPADGGGPPPVDGGGPPPPFDGGDPPPVDGGGPPPADGGGPPPADGGGPPPADGGTPPTDAGPGNAPVLDSVSIYADRNNPTTHIYVVNGSDLEFDVTEVNTEAFDGAAASLWAATAAETNFEISYQGTAFTALLGYSEVGDVVSYNFSVSDAAANESNLLEGLTISPAITAGEACPFFGPGIEVCEAGTFCGELSGVCNPLLGVAPVLVSVSFIGTTTADADCGGGASIQFDLAGTADAPVAGLTIDHPLFGLLEGGFTSVDVTASDFVGHVTVCKGPQDFDELDVVFSVVDAAGRESNTVTFNEDIFTAPTVPAEWTCDETYYGAADGCDCNCGAYDPDCLNPDAIVYNNCENGQICNVVNGLCENIRITEIEPNGNTDLAVDSTLTDLGGVTVDGIVGLANDQDFFAFTVPAGGADFNAVSYSVLGDTSSCVAGVDTKIFLYDAAGTELDSNDDANSLCSDLSAALATGYYFISVEYSPKTNNPVDPFPYFVDITLEQ